MAPVTDRPLPDEPSEAASKLWESLDDETRARLTDQHRQSLTEPPVPDDPAQWEAMGRELAGKLGREWPPKEAMCTNCGEDRAAVPCPCHKAACPIDAVGGKVCRLCARSIGRNVMREAGG